MNTWKVILATMIIFGTGVVTGGLLVRHTTLAQPVRPIRNFGTNGYPRPFISPALTRVEFLKKAERELNLTADQKEQADKIISASQERTHKLLEPVSPQIREELQQTKEQFRALLNAEQKIKFGEILKQQNRPSRHAPRVTEGPKSNVPAASTSKTN